MENKEKEHKKIYQKCLRCGRVLKRQENKELGYGPSCYKKMKNKKERKLF